MRRFLRLTCITVLTGLAVLTFSPSVEAQFLKKLSKGLEKVNKSLEKVENAVKGKPVTSTTKEQESPSAKKTQQMQPSKSVPTAKGISETGWKSVSPHYQEPFISPRTRYLQVPHVNENFISGVNDDIFAVKRGAGWEFWRVDGTKLFNADWQYCGPGTDSGIPMFSGGVTVVRRTKTNAQGKKVPCILYADGRVKELDPSYKTITHFASGLAIVQQEINGKNKYFFIDANGTKVYPTLSVLGDSRDDIRPLCNNRRAYRCKYDRWAFIDGKGNPAFSGTFLEARDFSDGYAWVRMPDTEERFNGPWVLLDTKGNVVFRASAKYNTTHINSQRISDVNDGIFYVEESSETVYYDISGKELMRVKAGTPFYNGYAFVTSYPGYDLGQGCMLVNKAFQPLKIIDKEFPGFLVNEHAINFKPFGLACPYYLGKVLNPEGEVVIDGYSGEDWNIIRGFDPFTLSGYCKCRDVNLDEKRYIAFMRPTGEIAWLFSDMSGGVTIKEPIGPEPIEPEPEPEPGDTIPKVGDDPPFKTPPRIQIDQPVTVIVVDENQKPVGPTTVDPALYKVTAESWPAEGGSVSISPSGRFTYGQYATVNAVPNKDWAVATVSSSIGKVDGLAIDKPFVVTTDQTIKVTFVKKDIDDKPAHTGAYQGIMKVENYDIPVYMQIDADGNAATPYGDNTHGFLSIMFDPETRYTNEKGEFAVSLFAVPLQITGVQRDESTGRSWLVLDGGSVSYHDLKVNPSMINPLFNLYIQMLMQVNGYTEITSKPRHYKVEMLDINSETGEFTLGNLQTFSAKNGGWYAGGDKAVGETTRGFMASKTDNGYPADAFTGTRMQKTAPRNDIKWYPPESWSKGKSEFEMLVNSMKTSYRNAKSDYKKLFGDK